jgi:hypothetical protein
MYLFEHIIRGDRGDGIPNIKSPDNTFVDGKRQFNLAKTDLERWVIALDNSTDPGSKDYPASQLFEGEMLRNWHRNRALIDLMEIPKTIQQEILDEYERQKQKPKKNLLEYFLEHDLNQLVGAISEF